MPRLHEIYTGLRSQIFAIRPEGVGIMPSSELPHVWAALMEWWLSDVAVTLVCVADGTTSLYFSNGGGVIGAGNHPTVARAAWNFLVAAESTLARMQPVADFPLPSPGHVRFYARAFTATYTAERSEEDLAGRRDDLWPLFGAGHEVLTQIRRLEERRRGGSTSAF